MKRLLLLGLLFVTPADAKTLIVANTSDATDATYGAGERASSQARIQILTSILDAFGASYVVIPPAAMRTEWARTGVVTWDFGTSSARTESFDAVIHAMFNRKSSGSPQFAAYRPDSLARTDKAPLVPQLMLGNNDGNLGLSAGSGNLLWSTAGSCSSGGSAYEGAGDGSGSHDEESVYYQTAQSDGFGGAANIGRARLSTASVAAKGLSVLLARGTGPIGAYYDEFFVWSTDRDSTGRVVSPDTAQVWIVRNVHSSGTKPIVYAHVAEGASDGAGGLNTTTEPYDLPTLMIALAALDSASGGLVFDNASRLPLGIAITVDGLCSRSSANNSGGIVPSDTANFYATLDSLDALDVPITYGVNLDSVGTYTRDLQYVMDSQPKARFSPQSRAGLDTAVAFAPDGGINHRRRAVDTFGRYRNAVSAVGPADGLDADTSIYARVLYARLIGDSAWGAARSSRFLMPPDDDWSPYNLRANQAGPTVDSTLYAFRKAGYKGVRINGAWDVGRPNLTPTNPRGYIPEQSVQRIRYGTEAGDRFLLLAHNGNSTGGNLAHYSIADSTAPGTVGSAPPSLSFYVAQRFWYGLFGYSPLDMTSGTTYNGASDENVTATIGRGRILKVSAQELAGAELNTSYKRTLRPSWWAIRQVVMPIRIMNRVSGRTLMAVQNPEEIALER